MLVLVRIHATRILVPVRILTISVLVIGPCSWPLVGILAITVSLAITVLVRTISVPVLVRILTIGLANDKKRTSQFCAKL